MIFNVPDPGMNLLALIYSWTPLLMAVVHIVFAVGMSTNIGKLRSEGQTIEMAPPFIWLLATLLSGVVTVGIFWLIHHMPRRMSVPPIRPVDFGPE